MIIRPEFPRPKNVFLINDIPVQTEIKSGDKFTAISNMSLLTSLRTGKINNYSKEITDSSYKGIKSSDIFTTYLSYDYFEEGSFDFKNEIVKGKDRIEGREYFKLEHQKDVWVMDTLWKQFQALLSEIEKVKPKLIIVTGKWALFFLTGCTSLTTNQGNYKDKKLLGGLNKFRSSVLQPHECFGIKDTVLVPIWHTLHAMAMPDKLVVMQLDIEKLGWMYHNILDKGVEYYIRPDKDYILGTTLSAVELYLCDLLNKLDKKPIKVSIDIETMYHSTIDCIGIAYEVNKGICIPFASRSNPNLWSIKDEVEVISLIREVMLHPNCQHVGQNYSYDCQYFHKLWNIDVQATTDTMVLHHVLFNYLPKDLAFLASLYCETYTYWKDEVEGTKDTPETRWIYNAKDVMYTLEIANILEDILKQSAIKLQKFYRFQQDDISPALVSMMNMGVKVDLKKKEELFTQLSYLLIKVENTIKNILGEEINLKSVQQVKKLFVDLLQVDPIISKKSKSATFGSDAMLVYLENYSLYRPLITLILEYRSIGVFVRTFLSAQVDEDNRMRTSYNVAGTKSYRLSSRKNAFGKGMNLANIPSKGKIDLKYALMADETSGNEDKEETESYSTGVTPVYEGITKLPNCKALFLPDEGYNFFNIDYSGADAMVVAWDSDCAWLQNFFNTSKEKLYIYVAREYLQRDVTTSDPFYKKIKQFIHLTNYGGMEEKAAASSGLSRLQAKELRQWYFSLCPEIAQWHKRIANEVTTRGYIENIFGARFWLLDKNCPTLLNQAYALIPQSTIGILVNKGLVNVYKNEKDIKVLLQIHDAIAGQYLKTDLDAPERIKKHMEIILPYEKPLVIPADISVSELNYGCCD